jgi:hypothetical protein
MAEVMIDMCTSFTDCDGGDYCKDCSHGVYLGEVFVNGKKWKFEFNRWFGPLFLRKDGEPRVRQPDTRNPVWSEFEKWHDAKFNNR